MKFVNEAIRILSLVSISILLGCNENSSYRDIQKYNIHSEQLISQWLLKFSENTDIICIVQPTGDLPEEERVLILKKLNTDEKHLEEQIRLSSVFQLTDSLVGNLRLISLARQHELEVMDKNGEPYWEWYNANCQGEWLVISKPIFNEDYSLAYFTSYTTCAVGSCGSGGRSVMKWERDKWVTIDNFDLVIH